MSVSRDLVVKIFNLVLLIIKPLEMNWLNKSQYVHAFGIRGSQV